MRPIAVALAISISCTGPTSTSEITRADLQREAASTLVPANTEAISLHQGSGYRMTADGPKWADDTSIYRTSQGQQAVLAFYDSKLRGSGWQRYHVFLSTEESDALAWCKDRVSVRVGIARSGSPQYAGYATSAAGTIFVVTLSGRDVKIACPS